jgi:hypothetical protein
MADDAQNDLALRGRRVMEEARDGVALVDAIVYALLLHPSSDALLRHPRVAALIRQLGEDTEDHNRTLLNFLPAPAFIQLDGTIASINPLHIKLLGGTTAADFIGEPVLRFLHAASRETFKELTREVERTARPAPPSTQTWLGVDGSEVALTLIAGPVIFRGRPAIRAIALRAGSSDSLDHLSRAIADCLLEAWQRRVAVPAHAEGAIAAAERRRDDDDEATDAVLRFAARLAAADDPAAVLRDFADGPPQRKTLELTHWLRGAALWMRERLDPELALRSELPEQRIFVSVDAKQLAAALQHLAAAARGDVLLSMAPTDDGFARIGFGPRAFGAAAERDPLRFAAVEAIVRRHGGRVLARDETLELALPTRVGDAVEDLLFQRLFASGPLKILIVVDDTLGRSRFGDAAYAHLDLRIVSRIGDGEVLDDFRPDLLLVDAPQFAIEGAAAFHAIAQRWPEIEMIICSDTARRDVDAPNLTYVPYDVATLLGSAERISTSSS